MRHRIGAGYAEALQFLEKIEIERGIVLGLGRVRKALNAMGNPQWKFKSVIVAGTNGKGSVCAMLSAMLQSAGYRTALYASPHLLDIRERIMLNGRKILKWEFVGHLRRVLTAEKKAGVRLTQFEMLTCCAFSWFAEKRAGVAVLEAGMGGRLDAVNAADATVAVITNVGLEHTEWLGKTISRIAREKAGIIRPHSVVASAAKQPGAVRALAKECGKKKARLLLLGKELHAKRIYQNPKMQKFYLKTPFRKYRSLKIRLLGLHQIENATCAVAAAEALAVQGIRVSEEAIVEGLWKARWPARFEIIQSNPPIVVDAAHNPAGARVLAHTLKEIFPGKKIIFVIGISEGKDARGIAKELAPSAKKAFISRAEYKGADPEKLSSAFARFSIEAEVFAKPEDALIAATAKAGKRGIVCATGSIYMIGELMKAVPLLRRCIGESTGKSNKKFS